MPPKVAKASRYIKKKVKDAVQKAADESGRDAWGNRLSKKSNGHTKIEFGHKVPHSGGGRASVGKLRLVRELDQTH